MKRVVIAVGGTGGHVLPALKIGRRLGRRIEVSYVGVGLLRNRYFEQSEVHYEIPGGKLPQAWRQNIHGILQARRLLRRIEPEYVIGFGSFHSFPVLAAAAYLGIPYYLFEFNVVPGRVNRLFSRGAKKTFIHFEPQVKSLKGALAKIDYAFEEIESISQSEALRHFGLEAGRKTLLVFGGSQGSDAINELIEKGAPKLKEEFQILHFPGKESNLKGVYDSLSIPSYVEPFCHRMHLAWAACDLAICRSGAGAMREMLMYEKPAILIPWLGAKDDHQMYNAKYMEEKVKGAICLKQNELTPDCLVEAIFASTKKIGSMKQSIQLFKQAEKRPSFMEELCESITL